MVVHGSRARALTAAGCPTGRQAGSHASCRAVQSHARWLRWLRWRWCRWCAAGGGRRGACLEDDEQVAGHAQQALGLVPSDALAVLKRAARLAALSVPTPHRTAHAVCVQAGQGPGARHLRTSRFPARPSPPPPLRAWCSQAVAAQQGLVLDHAGCRTGCMAAAPRRVRAGAGAGARVRVPRQYLLTARAARPQSRRAAAPAS